MRIISIDRFTLWVDWCNWILVRIRTDEGLVGWGEGSLHGGVAAVESAIDAYAEHLVGQDPAGPERHWHRLYNMWRWRGGCAFQTALSALDIALWDLEGKRLGVPVHRLLGGAHRDRVRAYASHWLSGAETPEQAAEGAREAVRRGFTAFKWLAVTHEHLRAGETAAIDRATRLMAAARDAVGPGVDIMVECSEFLSPRAAERLDRALAPYDPFWFEEPIPYENARAMAQLQSRIRTPIATGERLLSRHEFRELLELGGCRVLQPDIMHCGGFTEMRRIAALADTWYVPLAPHNPGGPICVAASLHLAAAIPNFLILEQMEPQRAARDRLSHPALILEDGHFHVPDAPGLGVEPDVEAIQAIAARPQPRRERTGAIYT
ncbi:galactonate dehydratase [Falsiroseomonas sp.]|uniref:galactonate dehydratase n=1 Tax=Falsiroseomonas sp. TaxID=2870721 RepID=UPI00356721C4